MAAIDGQGGRIGAHHARGGAAVVRELSPRITEAELTHLRRTPIDLDVARRQHEAYVACLARHGREIIELPPLPDHPDGVFVEDVVVIVGDTAVLTRPGAPSRRGEVHSMGAELSRRGWKVVRLDAPGTLDGGDVLQVGETVYVGASRRSSPAGAARLAGLLEPLGRRVVRVPVTGVLHLKSAATALPDGTIVALPGRVPHEAFAGHEVIDAREPTGGDVLLLGDTVIVSASAPRTADLIAARGFDVEQVQVDELEKAEAGVTCMSVLLDRP